MAGQRLKISTASDVALSAATPLTVLRVKAPTHIRLKILGWSISFAGVDPTDEPVEVKLVRQTTDGTFTSVTPVKLEPTAAETIQSTAGENASAEPTTTEVLDVQKIHPQRSYSWTAPFGRELLVAGGGRVGLLVTAPDAVECRATMDFEE